MITPCQRLRACHFVVELPCTSTNRVLRRVLRETAVRNLAGEAETAISQSIGRK
jgi:acyl-coenzyme A synthetase/AMP-(fatty) acid ligase